MLIVGEQATRTHARCFLRALGYDNTHELPANLVQTTSTEIYSYFNPNRSCDSYIISSASLLFSSSMKTIYEIITTGKFSYQNNITKSIETGFVVKPIILTAKTKEQIPVFLREKLNYIVELGEYTQQQLQLIVLQRLKYANIDYEDEEVLQLIVEYGVGNLHDIIRILKDAIAVMLADSRTTLTVEDVKQVLMFV